MNLFTGEEISECWNSLPVEIRDTPIHRAKKKGLLLKLETLQPTGSYKIRAAYHRLKAMDTVPGGQAVALSSSGNFASAFTWAAARFKLPAHLVVTPNVNTKKMKIAQEHPCTIHYCQQSYESRFETLAELEKKGIECIDHRQDRDVFLGHSTIGFECLQQVDTFQRVLIPVSTGGLALGVAQALRVGGFKGEILGVQPAGNPTLYKSWKAGEPIQRPGIDTICDALTATSIPTKTFENLREVLDDILLVEESSVSRAVGFLACEEGLVAEPGACVGVAALLELQRPFEGSLCLLTGRNITHDILVDSLKTWKQEKVCENA